MEGQSRRSDDRLCGRTDSNHMVVFDHPESLPRTRSGGVAKGDYVAVAVEGCTSATRFGCYLGKTALRGAAAAA